MNKELERRCFTCGITKRICVDFSMLDGGQYYMCVEHRNNLIQAMVNMLNHQSMPNSYITIDWSLRDDSDDDTDDDTDKDDPDGVLAEAYRLAREQGWEVGGYM